MSNKEDGHFILGISWNGRKFRPSDWIERIATAFGSFDASHRLRYNSRVMPVRYAGEMCLYVASSLAIHDSVGYNFIMDFANSNHLQVVNTNQTDMPEPPEELRSAA